MYGVCHLLFVGIDEYGAGIGTGHVDTEVMFFFVRLFSQRYADDIEQLPDVLADKVSLLPKLLKESRADNMCASYKRGFKRWRTWVLSNGLESKDALPAGAFHVALYLASLVQSANTHSPIINAFYSIEWFHDLFDLNRQPIHS